MAVLNYDQIRWLDALEHGNYEQGPGSMRSDSKGRPRYCCLGVACDVLGYELQPQLLGSQSFGVLAADTSNTANAARVLHTRLPTWINERFHLDDRDAGCLAEANDGGWSFIDIAKLLRYAWVNDERVGSVYTDLLELRVFLTHLDELKERADA